MDYIHARKGGLEPIEKKETVPQEGKNPNIIFIMADDMGYGDVGCYNDKSKIPTPNMDRLAKEGIRFTDAHTPSAVCSPTRYGVLTGRYCWRTWLKKYALVGYSPTLLEPGRMTVASLLKERGYETACIGKWHLGLKWQLKQGCKVDFKRKLNWPSEYIIEVGNKIDYSKSIKDGPIDFGFDYFFGTAGCSTTDPPYCFIENDHTVGIPSIMVADSFLCDKGLMVPNWNPRIVDSIFTEKAIDFLKNHRKNSPEKPFFLYLPLSAPHAPHLPPGFVKGHSEAGPRGDLVVLVDWSIGEVLKALDNLNLRENTLVIVTSDNGPLSSYEYGHKSSGDWRGYKGSIWEGGHRVPFIARWPGKIKPASISSETICLTDLLATCAAILKTELPNNAGEDSYNALPALMGEQLSQPIREAIVHHSAEGVFSIRERDWKLILGTEDSGEVRPESGSHGQLYNLSNDPGERNNLWDQHPEIVQRLKKLLENYKSQGHSRSYSE